MRARSNRAAGSGSDVCDDEWEDDETSDRCYSGVFVRGCAVTRGVNRTLNRCTCAASEAICFRLVTGREGRGTLDHMRSGRMFSLRVFAMDRRRL